MTALENYPYAMVGGLPHADITMLPTHSYDFNPMTKLWNRLEETIKYSRWNQPTSIVIMLENDVMGKWQELWGQERYFKEFFTRFLLIFRSLLMQKVALLTNSYP